MSLTAVVNNNNRAKVPAICHVDNTARLQTVSQQESPLYHNLIEAFRKKTGVPMVLNTSFNRKSQPIIEYSNNNNNNNNNNHSNWKYNCNCNNNNNNNNNNFNNNESNNSNN